MASIRELPPVLKLPLVGLLAWLVPGLGHLAAGDRNRGIIIMVTIALTFWGGIAIGGVRTTVDPRQKKLWFMAQLCSGSHVAAAYFWGEHERKSDGNTMRSYSQWGAVEVAFVYTGVAGLLNVLVILDALVRAESAPRRPALVRDGPGQSPPRSQVDAT